MVPPTPRMLWFRLALLVIVGGVLAFSPIPRQLFKQGGRGAPRWLMFSDVGTDVCIASYTAAGTSGSLGRYAVIEPGVALRPPFSARLRGNDLFVARTTAVCREHRSVQNIEVSLVCPGRRKRVEKREDVCEMNG
jgi:hypothetical protein